MDNALSTLLLSMAAAEVISLIYPDNGKGSAELPPPRGSNSSSRFRRRVADIEIRKGRATHVKESEIGIARKSSSKYPKWESSIPGTIFSFPSLKRAERRDSKERRPS